MFHISKIGFLGKTGIRIIVGLLSEDCDAEFVRRWTGLCSGRGWSYDRENIVDIGRDLLSGPVECGFGRFFGRPYDRRPDLCFNVLKFSSDAGTGTGYAAAQGL
jgi:hypothetical protein